MTPAKLSLLALTVTLALSGCSSVKRELGIARNSPDEFVVVKRAPLTLPPEYVLRPPLTPDEARANSETVKAAETAVLGEDKKKQTLKTTKSDSALLDKIGSTSADPDVRRRIEEENGYLALENRTLGDRLIFWKDAEPSLDKAPESIVDSKAESARIKETQQTGTPVNEGKVPTIERKKSTIEKLF